MNKNRYRVIFSQARGMFIAVAESVKSRSKTAGQRDSVATDSMVMPSLTSYKKLNPLNFAVIGLLGAVIYTLPLSSLANTQIIADRSAPTNQQPQILNSANGTAQVNIQAPSAGGVSRNTYSQFDVGQEGAILNNARNNTQTQIGGWVQGNPQLARGEAKVILNEVNSSNPSQLRGYLEVAGKSAQVVIANPSGLVCDGCGVINAERFTLTTGQAVMNQGYLESFRVREGQVTLDGKGLDGSLTPYTDIYTRALTVNAGLYANELKVVLGQNEINVNDPTAPQVNAVSSITDTDSNRPGFALDVGQLGGMYAGKIFLVGTEQGLGVRNAGSVNAQSNQLILNANGDLINSGNLIANKDQLHLNAENIKNTGNISSATSQVSVQSQNLDNSGLISSADELRILQQDHLNNSGTLNAARVMVDAGSLRNSGSIEQTGAQALDLNAGQMSNLGGKIGIAQANTSGGNGSESGGTSQPVEPANPAQDGGSLEVATSPETAPKTYDIGVIQVTGTFNNDEGAIVAQGGIDLESNNGLDNQGGQLNLRTVKVQGEHFKNDQGQLTVKQAEILTDQFTNQHGLLQSSTSLNISTRKIDNQGGKINALQNIDLTARQNINNQAGQIASLADLRLQGQNLNNTEGDLEAGQLLQLTLSGRANNQHGKMISLSSMDGSMSGLENDQGEITARNISLQTNDQGLNNAAGSIHADQNLNIQTASLDNAGNGVISSHGNLQINSQQLSNQGYIRADQQLQLYNAGTFTQQNGIISAQGDVKLISQRLVSDKNSIIAAGINAQGEQDQGTPADLTIQTDQALEHHGKLLASANIDLNGSSVDVSQGAVAARNIQITAREGDLNNQSGQLQAESIQLNAAQKNQSLINKNGQILAQKLNLKIGQDIHNQQGVIQHTVSDDLNLNVQGSIHNQQGRILTNANQLNIQAQEFNSDSGLIQHAGQGVLNLDVRNLHAQNAELSTNGLFKLMTDQAVFDQSKVYAAQGDIQASQFADRNGEMLFSGKNGPSSIRVSGDYQHQGGVLQSSHDLEIKAASVNNQNGVIQVVQKDPLTPVQLKISSQEEMNNDQGRILSEGQLAVQAGKGLSNQQGALISAADLDVNTDQAVNNQQGQLQAKNIQVSASALENSSGQMIAQTGDLSLNITNELNNGHVEQEKQAGIIQAAKNISIQTGQFDNRGLVYAGQNQTLEVNQSLKNAGQLAAHNNLNVKAGSLAQTETGSMIAGLASAGTLAKQGNLVLSTTGDVNAQGQLVAGGDLTSQAASHVLDQSLVQAKTISLNSQSGQLSAQQSSIQAAEQLNLVTPDTLNTQQATLKANRIQINAQDLNNQSGHIQQTGTDETDILLSGALNNQNGQIDSQGQQLQINALNMTNQNGLIQASAADGQLILNASNTLNNDQGTINAAGRLQSTSQKLHNDAGTIQNGFTVVKGGKYGSNNGFDHVWVAKDGSVTILSDSKQITNGTVKLSSNAAGGNTQLSDAWINKVLDNLPLNDPAGIAIQKAKDSGKLKTAVTGIDRSTGKAVIIPVNVPSKPINSKILK